MMRFSKVKAAVALATALVLVVGSPTDPVSAEVQLREHWAQLTLEEARAAAEAARGGGRVEVAAQPESEPIADGEIVPGEASTIDVHELDASVEFSGYEVAEPLEVTVSQLPEAAADTAERRRRGWRSRLRSTCRRRPLTAMTCRVSRRTRRLRSFPMAPRW